MNSASRMHRFPQNGFTAVELLCVIVIAGVLAAIAAPTWLRFLAEQQLTQAQGIVRQDIQEAQLKSQQNNVMWQVSVGENNGVVESAVHPVGASPSSLNWKTLDKSIQLDSETTFLSSGGDYYVRFDEKGNVRRSRLGRLTISSKKFPEIKRCVVVSTLLGATRTASDRPVPDPDYRVRDRFCY